MIVGEANKAADLDVNIAREKKLTNVRSVESDAKMLIAPPRQMSLEEAIGYVGGPRAGGGGGGAAFGRPRAAGGCRRAAAPRQPAPAGSHAALAPR
jgi:hypothetical protein